MNTIRTIRNLIDAGMADDEIIRRATRALTLGSLL